MIWHTYAEEEYKVIYTRKSNDSNKIKKKKKLKNIKPCHLQQQ